MSTTPPPRVRVILADDEPIMRLAVKELLRTEDFAVVGEAADVNGAVELADRLRPNVAILDAHMPGGGAIEALRRIRRLAPEVRCLVLSAFVDRESILETIQEGALGYLVKGSAPSQIVEAVRDAAVGTGALSGAITAQTVRRLGGRLASEGAFEVDRRERGERVRRVIDDHRMSIAFQPIVDLGDRTIAGYEALARFPDEGLDPVAWFAEAATLGLGDDLEVEAVRQAAEQAHELGSDQSLGVNASPEVILHRDLSQALPEVIMPRTVVEISEHAAIEDYTEVRDRIAALRALGARVAVDNAGAGEASLRHILSINPESIKLDISLTRDIERDPRRRAVARALISFAADIGASVVAEGIETQEQLDALRELGVGYGQGFLLGRPRPLGTAPSAAAV